MPHSYPISSNLYLVKQEVGKKTAATAKPVETPTNHIVVIDCSGSMYGELPRIREQLKRRIPKLMKEKDTLSVIWFSGRGQFGTLLTAEPVGTLQDLKEVERAIDRYLQTQGLTGFKEPLEEVTRLVDKIKKLNSNPYSLVFMSDGCDNCWDRASIIKTVEKLGTVVQASAFFEYGYYADRPLLTAMAEKAGGQLLFAQSFDSYVPLFEAVLQKRPTGAPRVTVTVEGDAVRGFVFALDGKDLTTYGVEGGKVEVSPSTQEVWYLSPVVVGEKRAALASLCSDAADGDKDSMDMVAVTPAYAALSLYSVRMAPEVVLPLLKGLGDVAFIEQFGGLFGKQRYSEFMDAAKAAAFDPKQRLTKGYDPSKVPAEDAFTVLDLLKLLASDDNNRVLLDDPRFQYSKISRGRMDAAQALTAEEQAEVEKLTTEMSKTKDSKKIAAFAAQIAAISDKGEGLKFVADPAPEGYSVSSLVYNEERPNISIQVHKSGHVDISKAPGLPAGLPAQFPTKIIRAYAIIANGIMNVESLPLKISAATSKALVEAIKSKRLPEEAVSVDKSGVTVINLKGMPVINRMMVKATTAKQLFENEWALLQVQATQKVYNSVLKEMKGSRGSKSFVELYGLAGAEWLKAQGFLDYGFNPKQVQAEATDVMSVKEMSIAIKGFSAIPSLNDFKKQAAKGKFTVSAQLMEPAWKDIEAYSATPEGQDPAKLEAWLETKQKSLDVERRARIESKAQSVFAIVVGQVWFSDFASPDDTTMTLKLGGQDLVCTVKQESVDIKI